MLVDEIDHVDRHFELSEIWVGKEANVGAQVSVPSVRGAIFPHQLHFCLKISTGWHFLTVIFLLTGSIRTKNSPLAGLFLLRCFF
jgi:hypothetical protein